MLLSTFGQAPLTDEMPGGLERPWTGPSAGPSRNLGSTGGTPEHREILREQVADEFGLIGKGRHALQAKHKGQNPPV